MKRFLLIALIFCTSVFAVSAEPLHLPDPASGVVVFTHMPTSALPEPTHSKQDEKEHHSNVAGIVFGTVLMAGGSLLFYEGQMQGDAVYRKYEKSAFTDNTDRLHRKMSLYNAMRIGGGVLAGSGLLVLVISF